MHPRTTPAIAVALFALPFVARAGGGRVTFQGFVNEPLGQADLSLVRDDLHVTNIGSSGSDGVAVDFGFPPPEIELDLVDAPLGPDGAFVELTTVGIVDGMPDQVLLVQRVEDIGDVWALSTDTTPLMSSTMSVSASQQDTVFTNDFTPPPPPSTVVATFQTGSLRLNPALAGDVATFASLRFDAPSVITFPQTAQVLTTTSIDTIVTGGPKIAGAGLRFELRAADIDPLVIEDEDTTLDCVDPYLAGAYCTAKTSSAGCVATMWPDPELGCDPVSGAADFTARALDVQGQKPGLLFFGFTGAAAMPFSGGTLCIQPPLGRGPVTSSGASPLSCLGSLELIVNDGGPWDPGAGNASWMQAWYRDPASGPGTLGTALSNAIRFDFQ